MERYRLHNGVWEFLDTITPRPPGESAPWVPLSSVPDGAILEGQLRANGVQALRTNSSGEITHWQDANGEWHGNEGSNTSEITTQPPGWDSATFGEWPPRDFWGDVNWSAIATWSREFGSSTPEPSAARATQTEAETEAAELSQSTGQNYQAVRNDETGQWFAMRFDQPAGTLDRPEVFEQDGMRFFRSTPDGPLTFIGNAPSGPDVTSLEHLIVQALTQADFNNPNDPFLQQAQAIQGFINTPTPQAKLELALQLATSPGDMQTLTRMLRGELPIQQVGPNGRVVPLNPILKQIAEDFFGPFPNVPAFTPGTPVEQVPTGTSTITPEELDLLTQSKPRPTLPFQATAEQRIQIAEDEGSLGVPPPFAPPAAPADTRAEENKGRGQSAEDVGRQLQKTRKAAFSL